MTDEIFRKAQELKAEISNVTILRPKMRFDEVVKTYGYPFISKEASERVVNAKKCINGEYQKYLTHYYQLTQGKISVRVQQLLGVGGFKSNLYDFSKWKPLLDVDFNVSNFCCNVMKKKPLHDFEKKVNKKPIIATMTEESQLRQTAWLKEGCNSFNGKKQSSKPLSFWTEQDVLQYIKQNNIKIASVYGDIVSVDENGYVYENTLFDAGKLKCSGCQRTGCIFCGFGCHLEKEESRFQRLKITHRKQYDYCMGGGAYDTDGFWKPNKDGLGMKHCIDELNKIYGKDFIKY